MESKLISTVDRLLRTVAIMLGVIMLAVFMGTGTEGTTVHMTEEIVFPKVNHVLSAEMIRLGETFYNIGNFILGTMIIEVTVSIFHWAITGQLTHVLNGIMGDVLMSDSLFPVIFAQYIIPIVAGCLAMYFGIVCRNVTAVVKTILLTVMIFVLSTQVLSHSEEIIGGITKVSTEIADGIAGESDASLPQLLWYQLYRVPFGIIQFGAPDVEFAENGSGDMVYLQDNDLYITGAEKDIMIETATATASSGWNVAKGIVGMDSDPFSTLRDRGGHYDEEVGHASKLQGYSTYSELFYEGYQNNAIPVSDRKIIFEALNTRTVNKVADISWLGGGLMLFTFCNGLVSGILLLIISAVLILSDVILSLIFILAPIWLYTAVIPSVMDSVMDKIVKLFLAAVGFKIVSTALLTVHLSILQAVFSDIQAQPAGKIAILYAACLFISITFVALVIMIIKTMGASIMKRLTQQNIPAILKQNMHGIEAITGIGKKIGGAFSGSKQTLEERFANQSDKEQGESIARIYLEKERPIQNASGKHKRELIHERNDMTRKLFDIRLQQAKKASPATKYELLRTLEQDSMSIDPKQYKTSNEYLKINQLTSPQEMEDMYKQEMFTKKIDIKSPQAQLDFYEQKSQQKDILMAERKFINQQRDKLHTQKLKDAPAYASLQTGIVHSVALADEQNEYFASVVNDDTLSPEVRQQAEHKMEINRKILSLPEQQLSSLKQDVQHSTNDEYTRVLQREINIRQAQEKETQFMQEVSSAQPEHMPTILQRARATEQGRSMVARIADDPAGAAREHWNRTLAIPPEFPAHIPAHHQLQEAFTTFKREAITDHESAQRELDKTISRIQTNNSLNEQQSLALAQIRHNTTAIKVDKLQQIPQEEVLPYTFAMTQKIHALAKQDDFSQEITEYAQNLEDRLRHLPMADFYTDVNHISRELTQAMAQADAQSKRLLQDKFAFVEKLQDAAAVEYRAQIKAQSYEF